MSHLFEQTNSDPPLGGRYKIIEKLGAGGFGQTFLAQDLHLPGHPRCVIKKLKAQTDDANTLSMARRLFDTEAKVLYQLGNHDQIPRLLAHFEDNQEFYLAQELIEGEPLTHELALGQPWTEAQAIALLQDILQVLAFVHEQQVIHRDLKPPNLIRRRNDGRIVLIDFGAVKQVSTQSINTETEQTNLTISIGTKGYMPNEQLAGTPRFSSDVYAVGMLGIQALTGVNPKRLSENPRTGEIEWREHAKHVSPEFADILDQMVRYDFRDRYQTAVEALEALQTLPAALLNSLPPQQPLSEAGEAPPSQELPPPPSETELTESELELGATDLWVPVESPQSPTSVGSTDTTAPLPQQEQQPHSSGTRPPMSATLRLIQRQFVKYWPVLAILAAVATTFAITKTLLSPDRSGAPVEGPTASPTNASTTPSPSPPKPKPAEILSQAESLRKAGQYQEALPLYDQAIALKPKMAEAYWGRCYSLNKLNKPAEAIVACNDAIDLKPNYAEALWGKGKALDQQKQYLEALQLYERAAKLKPDFQEVEAWVSLGEALQRFGRSVEAIRALDKAIDLNRNSADAWSTKGEALWNLGRFDEAIASLDKALQIQPNHPRALKLRKQVREQLGR